MVKVGDHAPNFVARAQDGKVIRLEELRGRFVVLYFFPKAFTPGCTKEAARFRDAYPDLQALGAEVIGVSTDDDKTMCDFAGKMKVTFPMLADGNRLVTAMYGVKWPLIGMAKRVTFLIDPEGVVQAVFHHEFQVSKHLDDVLHALERLQHDRKLRSAKR
jgi:thioredoxin-dependent peroxiredoxin